MDKVRFACPRCQTIMQTGADKVGYDVACPHCAHRFRLIESSDPSVNQSPADAATLPPGAIPPGSSGSAADPDFPSRQVRFSPTLPRSNPAPIVSRMPAMPPQGGFCCPYCQTKRPPIWKSEVSQIGWIVFAILLCTTCVFCFVGLFIRDRYRVCSQCKIRLG